MVENSPATDSVTINVGRPKRAFWIAVEVIAAAFWVYVPIKLFVLDIDTILVARYLPDYAYIFQFRFLLLIAGLSIALILSQSAKLLGTIAFIVFYPLILLGFRLPFFLWQRQSWILVFALANSVIAFVQSFKINFVVYSTLAISLFVAVLSSSRLALLMSIVATLGCLGVLFVRRLIFVFRPSRVFDAYQRLFPWIRAKVTATNANPVPTIVPEKFNEEQLTKWATGLQTVILYNRACLFLARKLQQYQRSRLNIVFYIFSLVALAIVTVVGFGGINLSLYKIDHSLFSYAYDRPPTAFTFFYYSFSYVFPGASSGLSPVLPVSQTFQMIETVSGVFLIVLMVALFFTVSDERYTRELNTAINGLEKEGQEMEAFITTEYRVSTVHDAIASLASVPRAKAAFIGYIEWLTKEIE